MKDVVDTVSHEAAGRMVAGAAPVTGLSGIRISSQDCLLADDFMLAAGKRPQSPTTCASPQGCSSIPSAWPLASPGVCDPGEGVSSKPQALL